MIYLDNAATTRVLDSSQEIIREYNCNKFFNPSALYSGGIEAKNDLIKCKDFFASLLGGTSKNIFFASSATQALNQVILGYYNSGFKHFVYSPFEHSAVFSIANQLKQRGCLTQQLKISNNEIDINSLEGIVNSNTNMICCMLVNNEIGCINNVAKVFEKAKQINPKIICVCDCVQAFMKIDINFKSLNADCIVISGHKFNAPKGCAVFYAKNTQALKPIYWGASQEQGISSGTENVANIMAMYNSAKFHNDNLKQHISHVKNIWNFCYNFFKDLNDCKIINFENQSYFIFCFAIKNIKSEIILHKLENDKIYIGNGSACSSKQSVNKSLNAIGIDKTFINGAIRLSFDYNNTLEEIKLACDKILIAINELKNIIERKQ